MREILFRGKSKKTGEWCFGNLVYQTMYYGDPVERYHILERREFDGDYYNSEEVIPETIGQFTGLTDKDGNKIFEGDIVGEYYYAVDKIFRYLTVEFIEDRGGWYPFANGDGCGCCEDETLTPDVRGCIDKCIIVGNIHDNPELLEEVENG